MTGPLVLGLGYPIFANVQQRVRAPAYKKEAAPEDAALKFVEDYETCPRKVPRNARARR